MRNEMTVGPYTTIVVPLDRAPISDTVMRVTSSSTGEGHDMRAKYVRAPWLVGGAALVVTLVVAAHVVSPWLYLLILLIFPPVIGYLISDVNGGGNDSDHAPTEPHSTRTRGYKSRHACGKDNHESCD